MVTLRGTCTEKKKRGGRTKGFWRAFLASVGTDFWKEKQSLLQIGGEAKKSGLIAPAAPVRLSNSWHQRGLGKIVSTLCPRRSKRRREPGEKNQGPAMASGKEASSFQRASKYGRETWRKERRVRQWYFEVPKGWKGKGGYKAQRVHGLKSRGQRERQTQRREKEREHRSRGRRTQRKKRALKLGPVTGGENEEEVQGPPDAGEGGKVVKGDVSEIVTADAEKPRQTFSGRIEKGRVLY